MQLATNGGLVLRGKFHKLAYSNFQGGTSRELGDICFSEHFKGKTFANGN